MTRLPPPSTDDLRAAIEWLEGINPDAEDAPSCARVAAELRRRVKRATATRNAR